MYQVLLVDDEIDILNTLQNNVDWASYGVETVLTARDGLDALKILEQTPITLMIADVKMPNMDGITLLREVRTKYPHIRYIILSSYREFSYAQEAINLGVENYLLKPVNNEELDQSIRKCLNNLSMHKHVMQSLFMENVLYRWITGDISNEDLAERSKHIHVNIYFRNYCVVLIKPFRQGDVDNLLSAFLLQLQPKYDAYHFLDYNSNHVLILGGHTIEQHIIQNALQDAIAQTNYQHNLKVSIGSVITGSDQVSISYRRAMDAMLLCGSVPGQYIVLSEDSTAVDISDYQLSQIATYLEQSLDSTSELPQRELFQEIFGNFQDYSLPALNSYINTLSIRLFRLLITLGMIDPQAENDPMVKAYRFEEMPSEDALYNCFCDILTLNLILVKKHMKRLSPVCLLAMQHISNNFTEYVSIKEFCNQHNINASYFGFLFRKETGIYFNDYLNQIRINHAMHLLENTNHKISQISKMSGFGNTSYFIQCFKKRTGLSPANFKQMLADSAK